LSLESLSRAQKKAVGSKQTLKAIDRNQAKAVYVARNADRHIIEPVIQACKSRSIPVVLVDSMIALGKACGIEVGSASAAIVEE